MDSIYPRERTTGAENMIVGNISAMNLREIGNFSVRGRSKHLPLPHKDAFTLLLNTTERFDWNVTIVTCGLSKDMLSSILAMEFESELLPPIKGCKYCFAFFNSN